MLAAVIWVMLGLAQGCTSNTSITTSDRLPSVVTDIDAAEVAPVSVCDWAQSAGVFDCEALPTDERFLLGAKRCWSSAFILL